MATIDTTKNKLKVLMFPWLAYGHASPFLELSKRLVDKNLFVYFCSTPTILSSIKKNMSQTQSTSIQLVDLHLQSSLELPPHLHTTKDIPNHLITKLKDALDMTAPSFFAILDDVKPDLVIYDNFQPWAPDLCHSHNVPAVNFLTSAAASISFSLYMVKYPERNLKEFPCPILYHRPTGLTASQRQKIARSGYYESIFRSSDIILIKSFAELEGEYFNCLSDLAEKKLVSVGPLLADLGESETGNESDEIIEWLDKKYESSTLFVCFGTEIFLKKDEIAQVALGLELSNVNFLWTLRSPVGEETKAEDVLPPEFFERVGNRGKVWEDWAPQTKILAHQSIGGYMTHCGWGSIMESMGMGVPIIAFPLRVDHPLNARLVEEKGIGVEVPRDASNGGMTAEKIAETIKKVMVGKDGENMRAKAKEYSDIMRSKDEEWIDSAVEELIKLCKKEK